MTAATNKIKPFPSLFDEESTPNIVILGQYTLPLPLDEWLLVVDYLWKVDTRVVFEWIVPCSHCVYVTYFRVISERSHPTQCGR